MLLSMAVFVATGFLGGPNPSQKWVYGENKLTVDGIERTFLLDVPKILKPGSPLVLAFHGYTSSAQEIREFARFTDLANRKGFVVAYPQGTLDESGKRYHNVGYAFHRQKTDDVRFARELAATLVRDLGLDSKSVFATGMSNGADMSYLLAVQEQPFVRAIAPVAGCMMEPWTSLPVSSSRIPIMEVHGREDNTTLWEGDMANKDGWGAYLGTDAVMRYWVRRLALEKSSVRQIAGPGKARIHRWWTSADSTEVLLYELPEGGHDWPAYLGHPKRSTAEVVWDFFQKHRPRKR